jgi:cytoskeletal protein RodZ
LIGRLLLYGALLVSTIVVVVAACGPERVVLPRTSPSPTVATSQPTAASTTTAPGPTATRTATAAPTTAAPTATAAASPTGTPPPGSTPATACPERTGGATTNQGQLTAIRIAHNPGFDRVVFEFGPSTAPGVYGMPPFRVAVATSLSGPSGQPVPIEGNALFGVRFQNASTVNPADGSRSYTGPTSLKPTTTPLVKEVRLVEDFERVLVWGVGLQRLQCPNLLTLSGPVRLVLDFPTPP